MSSGLPYVIGAAHTGLTGPQDFVPIWAYRRRGVLQRSARRRARWLRTEEGEQLRRVPLYLEAVSPPLQALRHLLTQLAQVVQIHHWDIGFDMLYAFFPGSGDEAWIDFADGDAIEACPRDGTRWFFGRWRHWFGWWYAELQKRALANGRYFPPPTELRVRMTREGAMRVEIGYAPGFLPAHRLYVLAFEAGSKRGRGYLLAPDEPLPPRPGLRALVYASAERWRAADETLLWTGTLVTLDATLWRALREGDALIIQQESARGWTELCAYWQGQRLGYVAQGYAQLCDLLERKHPLRFRVVRLGMHCHTGVGVRVACAAYGVTAP